ncbi:MAG: hypothetical protein SPC26_04955 [Lactobacillus amylovorus]|nr:hypothetical protein [Lactobacillus amylovorus]
MITKYYSEKTKKEYSTEKECIAAEKEYDKANAEKEKERALIKKEADEINKAYEELKVARKKYNDLVNEFIKEHNSYHLTISNKDFFDTFFDNFWLF